MGANKILEVMNYSYYYDQICAVRELSFHVNEGEVVTLIGSNGAGKTTTLRSISGLIRGGGRGGIKYMGKNIENLPPHRISSMGIAQCLEGRQVFPHLSVKENLQMGAFTRTDKKGISDDFDYVYNLFPRLLEREGQMAGTLSGGEQQMLAVGRALMQKPKILMMDEPSLGLAPIDGMTILLVEQNSQAALTVADRGYIMETGMLKIEDTAENLLDNDIIKKSYLGIE